MQKQSDLFEMRRLEALSNTIFGVAMTLLAYDLPKATVFANSPAWMDIVRAYAQPVIALMISFIVAGLFWFSHHRRLAIAPQASRGVVFLNLHLGAAACVGRRSAHPRSTQLPRR